MKNKERFRDEGVRFFVNRYKGSVSNMLSVYHKWKESEYRPAYKESKNAARN